MTNRSSVASPAGEMPAAPAPAFPDPSVHNPHGATSLRRRFVAVVGASAVVLLAAVGWGGDVALRSTLAAQGDARLTDAARRSILLVERVLSERRRHVEMIADAPLTIEAARRGGEMAEARGLPRLTTEALEARFKETRSQQADPQALTYLRGLDSTLDIAEVMVTDQHGYNAVTTTPSSDFVQSDEAWWQRAWQSGTTAATAAQDPATGRAVVELAHLVGARAEHGMVRYGVAKVKFGLAWVDTALIEGSAGTAIRVDLVDSAGRIIASSAPGERFRALDGWEGVVKGGLDSTFTYYGKAVATRAAAAVTNEGRWRIVAHTDEAVAFAAYHTARTWLVLALLVLLVAAIAGTVALGRFIERRITGPAAELAAIAEAVAAGDLSLQARHTHADDEIGRLSRAVAAMIVELRRMTAAMTSAAHDTSSMSAQITAGSEEMAASAGEIASTASDLSQQSTTMAHTIQLLARSAEELVTLATELDRGAHEGVERNSRLRALSTENRARLDESSAALDQLTTEVATGAAAVDRLAGASAEVRTFVTLVHKLARQSKLLALNAAMEAARAGEHGEGFAVVAAEVRRLSAMSSDAAERTQKIVAEVLLGVEESRASSERTVATVQTVREATQLGSGSFIEIERAVAETEGWTGAIERAASSANSLAGDVRSRLGTLAQGTESFAAAMQQVAASSQEQSASTEEIAAAASTLATAAERLQRIVARLRLESVAPAPPPPSAAPEAAGEIEPADAQPMAGAA